MMDENKTVSEHLGDAAFPTAPVIPHADAPTTHFSTHPPSLPSVEEGKPARKARTAKPKRAPTKSAKAMDDDDEAFERSDVTRSMRKLRRELERRSTQFSGRLPEWWPTGVGEWRRLYREALGEEDE